MVKWCLGNFFFFFFFRSNLCLVGERKEEVASQAFV